MIPNNSRQIQSIESHIGVPITSNVPIDLSSPISSHEKPDGTERDESIVEETTKPTRRSKSLIFGVLISMLALCGMGILFKSSCGGSLSLKLVPPELQLNTGSCAQVEQTPGQSLSKN
jgi:hypothetical protein